MKNVCGEHRTMPDKVFEKIQRTKSIGRNKKDQDRLLKMGAKLINCPFFLFILCKISKLTLNSLFKYCIVHFFFFF